MDEATAFGLLDNWVELNQVKKSGDGVTKRSFRGRRKK
jgi:hypothetical protein